MTQHDKPAPVEAKPPGESCPNPEHTFGQQALKSTRFDQLSKNEKETANLMTDTFAKGLTEPQQQLFKDAVVDVMEKRVGSLGKLALPENGKVAEKFIDMMKASGFDVSMERGKDSSINIFEQNSKEGMRLSAVKDGANSWSPCATFEPVERDKAGRIQPSKDFFAVTETQQKLSERMKNIIDRD